jgi:DNA-binding transcriptional LysR family regulator
MRNIVINNINFFQIQMCLAIVKHGSISNAAVALNVTQPTISKQLSDLERQLSMQLFVRGKNKAVQLTPAGKVLIDEWEKIAIHMDVSIRKAIELNDRARTSIIISILPSTNTQIFLEPLLESFSQEYRDIDARLALLSPSEQNAMLMSGTIDVAFLPAFSEGSLDSNRIKRNHILSCPWYVGMLPTNPLSRNEDFAIKDLAEQGIIVPSPQLFPEFYLFVESLCATYGFIPKIAYAALNHLSIACNLKNSDEVFFEDGCSSLLTCPDYVFHKLPEVNSGVVMAHDINNGDPMVMNFLQHAKNFFSNRHHCDSP